MNRGERIRRSIAVLKPFLGECLRGAEKLLGLRDGRWEFPHLRVRTDGKKGPFTCTSNFPRLPVFLPECCLLKDDLTKARWHIAHESVHVLDPPENPPTNYLEEGLATWFQNYTVEGGGISEDPWAEAKKRVEPWMHVLPDGLKRFRDKQRELSLQRKAWTKLGCITADVLQDYCPDIDDRAAELLVDKFPI